MFKCLECGAEFEEPTIFIERCHPFNMDYEGCPHCGGAYEWFYGHLCVECEHCDGNDWCYDKEQEVEADNWVCENWRWQRA